MISPGPPSSQYGVVVIGRESTAKASSQSLLTSPEFHLSSSKAYGFRAYISRFLAEVNGSGPFTHYAFE